MIKKLTHSEFESNLNQVLRAVNQARGIHLTISDGDKLIDIYPETQFAYDDGTSLEIITINFPEPSSPTIFMEAKFTKEDTEDCIEVASAILDDLLGSLPISFSNPIEIGGQLFAVLEYNTSKFSSKENYKHFIILLDKLGLIRAKRPKKFDEFNFNVELREILGEPVPVEEESFLEMLKKL